MFLKMSIRTRSRWLERLAGGFLSTCQKNHGCGLNPVFQCLFAPNLRLNQVSKFEVGNEREKKRHYNQRVVQVERGSFTPLVFRAYRGFGRERHHFVYLFI